MEIVFLIIAVFAAVQLFAIVGILGRLVDHHEKFPPPEESNVTPPKPPPLKELAPF